MGVVYKAHDARLDRPVAIKVLPPEKRADPAAKQRFVREAKAASALNHPGIVTIHDIRSDAGMDFIVMEWIDGKTLDELIPAKGMRAVQALRYAVQIADALATGARRRHPPSGPEAVERHGHARGPDQDPGFRPGQAPRAGRLSSDETTIAAPLTEERMLVGTAAYMSPEQAEGRKLDARSDIFSFGAVLYEMATGQRPFTGDSSLSILARILNEDPTPPTRSSPSIPPELERTILRCLRKDPGRRYQTMADLKVALEDIEAETASGRTAPRLPVRRRGGAGHGRCCCQCAGGELRWVADVASRRTGGAASS